MSSEPNIDNLTEHAESFMPPSSFEDLNEVFGQLRQLWSYGRCMGIDKRAIMCDVSKTIIVEGGNTYASILRDIVKDMAKAPYEATATATAPSVSPTVTTIMGLKNSDSCKEDASYSCVSDSVAHIPLYVTTMTKKIMALTV
jgi:hypothetical protein